MAKVYLICGKLCCGKTTYSQKICDENDAVSSSLGLSDQRDDGVQIVFLGNLNGSSSSSHSN